MRPDDERAAQLIRLIEQEHEESDPGAGDRPHEQRQNGEEREALSALFRFAFSRIRNHSRRVSTDGG